jgi:hypothetical protein
MHPTMKADMQKTLSMTDFRFVLSRNLRVELHPEIDTATIYQHDGAGEAEPLR